MRRIQIMAVTSVVALLSLGLATGTLRAQTEPDLYGACKPGETEINAADLPRVVEQERCPVAGRTIVDEGGPGTVLPEPGMAVHTEWLALDGAQELSVANPEDGTFILGDTGEEPGPGHTPEQTSARTDSRAASDGCRAKNFSLLGHRVYGDYAWRFNSGSTPGANAVGKVEKELRLATSNITNVDNPCGIRDGVEPGHVYRGRTAKSAGFDAEGHCGRLDGASVTDFGGAISVVAATCSAYEVSSGADRLTESDMRLNKVDFAWTTEVNAGCRQKLDVQAVTTHERGHTFGLDHVGIDTNPYQTMNPLTAACDTSMRSLGRGDSLGLNRRYE